MDGDVPRSTSYGVYISQRIRFARVCSHVADFNARNKSLNAKSLQQGYRYHKLRKTSSKFYRRHFELVSKFNVGLKPLLHQGLSDPESRLITLLPSLIARGWVGRQTQLWPRHKATYFSWLGPELLSVAWPTRGLTVGLFQCFSGLLDTPGISRCRSQQVSAESSLIS